MFELRKDKPSSKSVLIILVILGPNTLQIFTITSKAKIYLIQTIWPNIILLQKM